METFPRYWPFVRRGIHRSLDFQWSYFGRATTTGFPIIKTKRSGDLLYNENPFTLEMVFSYIETGRVAHYLRSNLLIVGEIVPVSRHS